MDMRLHWLTLALSGLRCRLQRVGPTLVRERWAECTVRRIGPGPPPGRARDGHVCAVYGQGHP